MIKTNIKIALKSLYSSKQRSLLALIGITIGIGSVIAMISVGTIVQEQALKQFKDMGVDIFTFSKKGGGSRNLKFTLKDIVELPYNTNKVLEVAPYTNSSVQFSYAGKETSLRVMGVTESFLDLNKLSMKQGRFISDLDEGSFYCVLGERTVQNLNKMGFRELMGKKFKFGDRYYTVVGILNRVSEGGGFRPFGINESVLIHVTTSLRAFNRAKIRQVIAKMGEGVNHSQVAPYIEKYFSARVPRLKIRIRSAEELIARMEKQMRLYTLLLGAIGSISLLVGGVGVMNVMLVSVSERRKEIGIRRALGAMRRDIQGQFIIESVVLCMIGGAIGIMVGIGISYLFAHFNKWDFMVSQAAIVLGLGVSTGTGVFFGYYPSRQASKLDPIIALRSE